jgi:hypothetical protein
MEPNPAEGSVSREHDPKKKRKIKEAKKSIEKQKETPGVD